MNNPTSSPTDLVTPPTTRSPGLFGRLDNYALSHPYLLLGAVLALAAFLRFWRIGERSIWYDESFSLELARKDWSAIIEGTAADYHPPLPYFVLKVWLSIAGDTVLSGRILSAVLGLGFVAVTYGVAREMFGSRTALIATLFAALSPFQVLFSQEIRHYSLQALLGATLLWSFYRVERRGGWLNWLYYTLLALLSLYNLYFSIFSLLALNGWYVALQYWRWRQKKWQPGTSLPWLVANLVVAVAYVPWVVLGLQQVSRVGKNYWIAQPNPLEFTRFTNVVFINATDVTTPPLPTLLGLLIGALLTIFTLYFTFRFQVRGGIKGRQRRSYEVVLVSVYWFVPLVVVLVISYLYAPVYLERSLIGISVAAYILVARLIFTAARPALWFVLLVPALVALVWALLTYYYNPLYTTHYDNEIAARQIAAQAKPGDITLHSSKLSFLPFKYLQATGAQYLIPEEPGNIHDDLSETTRRIMLMPVTPVAQVLAKLPPGATLWYVRNNPQPGQTTAYLESIERELAARFTRLDKDNQELIGLEIWRYS